MKKMLFTALLTVAIGSASYSRELVAEGKTYSALGDYRIELADDPITINGEVFKAFVISYQNTPLEVKVAVRKEHNCKKYIVLSEKLSVQYVCNANYFGVERLDKSFEKDGYATSDLFLDRNEYFHQKVLTSGQGCELDNTRLIASYFPMLIKENGNSVVSK
jgi:hypothetical protein